MINWVHANRYPGLWRCVGCNFSDQMGMLNFTPNRGTIFTIQCDIENARAKLLRHLSLQLQAFAHPHFDTTVVITNRQYAACRL